MSIAREVNCSGQDVFEVCVVETRGILRGSTAVRCLYKVDRRYLGIWIGCDTKIPRFPAF